jgi:UrcA family protein
LAIQIASRAATEEKRHVEASCILTVLHRPDRRRRGEYDDLDLTTETGMKKLDQRINMAARKVCGSAETLTGTRLRDKSSIDCVKEAAAKARAQIAATKPVSKS